MEISYDESRDQRDGQYREKTGNTEERMKGWARLVLILIVVTFLVTPSGASDNEIGITNPTVIITGYQVTPAVLLPGDTGTVTLTIKNTAESASMKENSGVTLGGTFASTKSTDINAFIEKIHLEENGIKVLTDDFDRLGELGPGQSIPVTLVIQAPEKSGIYFPEVWIDVKGGRSTRYPITVNVNTDISTQKKPALFVSQIRPDQVAPGDNCVVAVNITNTGLTRASDIAIDLNSTIKSLVLTTAGHYYMEHLDPGEGMNFTLHLATDKNTPIGIDPVILTIVYHNPDGTIERQIETIGIPVKGKAVIAVKSFSTDPVRPVPGNAFTLIIRVENTGTDQANSVQAALESPFSGTNSTFIGSIDKNSDAPAIFYLQATMDGTIPTNLTISYNDDFGSHKITEQATITTSPGSGILPIVVMILILLIIVGGGYWYLRIRPGKWNGE
ncbi:COG1361 S-layer family protein [Methanospirillum lacunae]|uniref:S-layer protein n=1 Tax=Methanospirillum lacunae TaxID=668570 RepID=A0A2V2MVT4_9EURY|nr:hypothetical protein [Methanospirillum lacunae]PWR70400.1 hypothetical protein DK846_15085 [Methanospirillum lacunae]